MSGALACLAVAALAWPAASRSALRPAAPAGPPGGRGSRARPWAPAGSAEPFLAGAAAALTAATITTPLVGGLAGLCAALAVRSRRTSHREVRAGRALLALADLLGAVGGELRSGRPVAAAIDAALSACADEECARRAGPALRAAGRGDPEPGAGVPRSAPFDEGLSRVLAAVRLSNRTGCSLAAVLAAVEDDLRARQRHALEARTASAGPRASAALLAGLPVLALLMGGGVGADPWRVLTTTSAGQVLLVVGVGLEIAGVAWSAHLVRRALR